MIRFDCDTLGDLDTALRRERLQTNGLGGFAFSTIIGLNTRRYHGLLTAPATCLSGFHDHLSDAGQGQVSEIFAGDAPHHPRGCIAQAWSVAELLRATVEDGLGRKPTLSK
jgi:glycogen debranching enzyme